MVPSFVEVNGWSFKGVMQYLMHDIDHAPTSARVEWNLTLNLAHDEVEHALAEMIGTAKHAEVLKAEAGVHRGGTPTEKPVKHFSLNWHPSETPTKKEMIATTSDFLVFMGWQDHQAIIVCHNDRPHPHVHVIINRIHPERGTCLDDGFEKCRAQNWAMQYELGRDLVFCTQRLLPTDQRTPAMTRPAWEWSRKAVEAELEGERQRASFDPDYMGRLETRREIEAQEWRLLKDQQRDERVQFFAEGKEAYKAVNRIVYREVRSEMRADWASLYSAKRNGLDFETLQQIRASLIARQKEMLDERREAASADLRAERDQIYRALLDEQKAQRTELIGRQEVGLRSPHLLDATYGAAEERAAEKAATVARDESEKALDRFKVNRGRTAESSSEASAGKSAKARSSKAGERSTLIFRSDSPGAQGRRSGPSRDIASNFAGGLLGLFGALGESMTGKPGKTADEVPEKEIDALERFGVTRGRPPDLHQERVKREKAEAEAWHDWKKKRELDRSRSGW